MTKYLTTLIAAASALAIAPALAADLPPQPTYKAPVMAPVVYNWSGFYIGGHVGYGWGDARVTPVFGTAFTAAQAATLTANGSPTLEADGFLGGFQAGFNVQSGAMVFGIEADFSFSGIKGSRNSGLIIFPLALALIDRSFSEEEKLKWVSTVRGRLGFTATPDLLLYVTGGVAFGEREYRQFIISDPAVNFNNLRASVTDTKVGWTAGAGLEYALSRNWSVKGEYLYVDLGTVSGFADSDTAPGFGVTLNSSSRLTLHTARFGINYKFDWGPVVAKY